MFTPLKVNLRERSSVMNKFFLLAGLILCINVFALENNSTNVCKQFQNPTKRFALFIDDKTGKSIENINLGKIKYNAVTDEFTFKQQSRLILREKLIPHGEMSNYRYIDLVKTDLKFKCKGTVEYLPIVHLRTDLLSTGKFTFDYQINIEDPNAEEPMDYVATINTKLTGTFIGKN